jgi:hypothetical protein
MDLVVSNAMVLCMQPAAKIPGEIHVALPVYKLMVFLQISGVEQAQRLPPWAMHLGFS